MTETPAYARKMSVLTREPLRAARMKQVAVGILVAAAAVSAATNKGQWLFGLFGALVAIAAGRYYASLPDTAESNVEVSRAGVRVDGVLIPATSIAQAYWVPRTKGLSSVRLQSEVGATIFEARVPEEADAQAFLEALGRDVSHQRVAFEADTPYGLGFRYRFLSAIAASLGLFALLKLSGIFATILFTAVTLNYLVMTLAPAARVEVGADGVLVAWLASRRFFAYADLASIEPLPKGVRFVTRDGKVHDVQFRHTSDSDVEALVRRDALLARAHEAMEAATRASSRKELLALLARSGRSPEQWTKEVLAIRGVDGYRTAAVRDEDLWAVVRDPAAPADARAAAALVLRRTTNDRANLRVAADTIAEPRLRVALEAVADADEEAMEAALADMGRE